MDLLQTIDENNDDELLSIHYLVDHVTPVNYHKYTLRYLKEHAPKPRLYQMFTFTTDPDKQNREAQEEYIKSILKRKQNLDIFSLWYCVEHEDTNLHFHVGIGAYRSIPPDAFKQYAKIYGSVKKSKKISENSDGISDYTTKEVNSIKLL